MLPEESMTLRTILQAARERFAGTPGDDQFLLYDQAKEAIDATFAELFPDADSEHIIAMMAFMGRAAMAELLRRHLNDEWLPDERFSPN